MTAAIPIVAAVIGAGAAIYSSEKAAGAQRDAEKAARQQQAVQAGLLAADADNRTHLQAQQLAAQQAAQEKQLAAQLAAQEAEAEKLRKSMQTQTAMQANANAAISKYQQESKGGQSGTLLTGPTGVDPATLTLGKSTLLGA